jgi:hypothetical protein
MAVCKDARAQAYLAPATYSVVAATGIPTAQLGTGLLRIQGSGGAIDITANPQIAAGVDGQTLILEGRDNVNTVKFDTGTGLALNAGASATLGKGDILALLYNSTDVLWYELYRSNN